MAHETFYTEGYVLGGSNVGEGHRLLKILTKDFGMIVVHARSVREERSKLRYSLQQFSKTKVSLVRGKEGWKLTGAEQIEDVYGDMEDKGLKEVLSKVASLLRRLIHGEGESAEVYEVFEKNVALLKGKELSHEELVSFEYLFVLRILSALGYAGENVEPTLLKEEDDIATQMQLVQSKKIALRDSINRALQETQL